MAWVRIESGYWSHPKVVKAGGRAASWFVAAICYAAEYRTDGAVDKSAVRMIAERVGIPSRAVNECLSQLCNAGLVSDSGDAYVIHDYLDYQFSREQIEASEHEKHEAKVRAGRIGGLVSGARRREAEGKQEPSRGQAEGKQNEAPSQSIPSRTNSHLPTTESDASRNGDGGRGSKVLELMVRVERNAATDVRDEKAWATRVRTNLAERYGAEIERVCARYPDAPCDVIAGYVRGESTSIRYYAQADS